MTAKKQSISQAEFASHEASLRERLTDAIEQELADCAIPDLADDPTSGQVWASLPTVDSKTAHKISASVIEQILGCAFQPAWIRRGGYTSVGEAVTHVVDQIRTHCVTSSSPVAA